MKKLALLACAVLIAIPIIGCGSNDSVPEGEGMEKVLKDAGVSPEGQPKNQGMPKADSPPSKG
jgi:hypothetical protein